MPKHRQGSIFYKIVPRSENPVTEVLCNLFQYKNVRDTLLRFFEIPSDKIDKIRYDDINTQKVKEDTGMPDIVIQNSEVTIFIENKVNQHAPLQGTQVNQYLTTLEKDEKAGKYIRMIYLVPKGYDHSGEIEYVIADKQRYAIKKHWEDFIKYIEKNELDKTTLFVSEFISHYKNLFIQESLKISLNTEEMELLLKPKDLNVANSLISKITKIMEEVIKQFKNEPNDSLSLEWTDVGEKYWHNEVQKGVYIKYKGQDLLFFGLWFDLVKEKPELSDYLFCYATGVEEGYSPKQEYVERFRSEISDKEVYGWYVARFPNFSFSQENAPQVIAHELRKAVYIMTKME